MICLGSRGFDVAVLQVQLNKWLPAIRRLTVDGVFGSRTDAALRAFQTSATLRPDGVVGVRTQHELSKLALLVTADHGINHIPQPTNTTCWAASTAMMTGSTVPQVLAQTPQNMYSAAAGLFNSSGSDQGIVSGQQYGNVHGLRCFAPMSWTVASLSAALQRSPLMFDTLWNTTNYAAGNASPGHMIVVSAIVSDRRDDGSGTYLYVLDPWPPNAGVKSWVQYQQWMQQVPTRTYRVFSR